MTIFTTPTISKVFDTPASSSDVTIHFQTRNTSLNSTSRIVLHFPNYYLANISKSNITQCSIGSVALEPVECIVTDDRVLEIRYPRGHRGIEFRLGGALPLYASGSL